MPTAVLWRDTLLAVLLVSALPALAAAALARHPARVRRYATPLACAAAGTLAGSALFHVLPDALADAAAGSARRAAAAALAAGGFVAAAALARTLHAGHAHAAPALVAAAGGTVGATADADPGAVTLVAVGGDALHSLLDGALLAAAFLAHPAAGVLTALAVALHEVPRRLGTLGALVHGDVAPSRALAFGAAPAAAAAAGAAATLALGDGAARLAHALLPFAAGGALYVALALLAPLLRRTAPPGRRLGFAALGAAVAAAPGLLH